MLDEKYNFKKISENRTSGVLLHITSLPNEFGIGSLGEESREFIIKLKQAGQTWWQILPIGPTGYGDSPYQSFSSFAGNPYLINLDYLKDCSLLTDEEITEVKSLYDCNRVDFGKLYNERYKTLRRAYERFDKSSLDFESFCRENSFWLNDYALFMTLKDENNGKPWQSWEDKYKFRDKEAIEEFENNNFSKVNFYRFLQFQFFSQWDGLKRFAHENGIKIVGDLPIYVAEDSCDCWANSELFSLDENLKPIWVGGCPPDGFSEDGQLWGNPCYDWQVHEETDYDWWVNRFKWLFSIFDCVRIDHFRGFESYWRIPAGDDTARNGSWIQGPGMKLFSKLKDELGELPIIAEDLGYMTKEVYEFRRETGFPGMKILLFAFAKDASSDYLPHNMDKNFVVYPSTHDSDTVIGWIKEHDSEEVEFAKRYLNMTEEEGLNWGMIRGAMTSVADMAIFQMQDILGLGNETRMNYPGTASGNWTWRMKPGEFSEDLIEKLKLYTQMSGRLKK
ncbi:4-alpha-glucanotransferase [Lagierella massiliensis]|uniref:4-alpha-glucanotransferase n=1 Tax=Lagierella massiliensis TaxID=1689303 RepID=UPI0006D7B1C2|nr:4-alpha-glucanotransferase [Lagierella massiliensis]